MPSFARRFKYTDAESAEEQYLQLIKSTAIVAARRKHLMREYQTFKANEAKQYWESLRFKLSLKSTAWKAAVSSAEAGLHVLQAEYSTYKEDSDDQSNKYTSSGSPYPAPGPSLPGYNFPSISPLKHPRDPFDDNGNSTKRAPLSPQTPPVITVNELGLSQDKEDDGQDEDIGGEDGEVNDIFLTDTVLPAAWLAWFDQVADSSKTPNALVSHPNRDTLSSPPVQSCKEGACSTGPPSSASLFVDRSEDLYGQLESRTSTDKNRSQSTGISFGHSLTMDDLNLPRYLSPNNENHSDIGNVATLTDQPLNQQPLFNLDLPSCDPNDPDFLSDQDLYDSTSGLYAWNFLEGDGRHDSNVESTWTYSNVDIGPVDIGPDLMYFRDQVLENNGSLAEPYEKL
ncbi:hypothetical protein EMPS_06700 [Entomortierella parvispora]|uniref:Uncharacterized protein n=1 Tax=Entomortierella parvispora TaxID=205924 RepID=A0A9P3HDG7_9FUNG|nr:hypothetical protein EMPS_06700 [Entomortierella parvispora]